MPYNFSLTSRLLTNFAIFLNNRSYCIKVFILNELFILLYAFFITLISSGVISKLKGWLNSLYLWSVLAPALEISHPANLRVFKSILITS